MTDLSYFLRYRGDTASAADQQARNTTWFRPGYRCSLCRRGLGVFHSLEEVEGVGVVDEYRPERMFSKPSALEPMVPPRDIPPDARIRTYVSRAQVPSLCSILGVCVS